MTGTVTVPYADPANEVQWADDFLTYINAPVNDQSLAFITAAELEEGVFHPNADFVPRKYGDDNKNNPLDSTQFEAGGVVWAENGGDPVWQFPTLRRVSSRTRRSSRTTRATSICSRTCARATRRRRSSRPTSP